MRNFCNYSTHCLIINPFNNLIKFSDSQTSDCCFLSVRIANRTAVILNFDCAAYWCCFFFFLCHCFIYFRFQISDSTFNFGNPNLNYNNSSTCLPRRRATSTGSFIRNKPSKVARITLCGFVEPRILVRQL
jgi:hypothetical protein